MRSLANALSLALGLLLFAGCGAGIVSQPPPTSQAPAASVIPDWMHLAMRAVPPQPIVYAATPKTGFYAAEFWGTDVLGYRSPNKSNSPPVCQMLANYVNGIGVDASGNVVVPNGYPVQIDVYRGPKLCGKLAGTFDDKYGQASDAATLNALNGTIVIANIEASRSNTIGNAAVCSLAKGCYRELKNKKIKYEVGGVALAKNGDCWLVSEDNASFTGAKLTYFKKCTGSGTTATGWKNGNWGGLLIDKAGNLVSIDFTPQSPALWVYHGCNPGCKKVAGPLALEGDSFYGSLSKNGSELVLGDSQYGQVDVYAYKPKKITYEYSFNNGLSLSEDVEAAAISPSL